MSECSMCSAGANLYQMQEAACLAERKILISLQTAYLWGPVNYLGLPLLLI